MGELTVRVGIWVIEVPDSRVHKVSGPLHARLARRWLEDRELDRRAGDLEAVKLGGDHARNKTSEGVELVQPHAPELGDGGLGDRHTAEQGELDAQVSIQECAEEGNGVLTVTRTKGLSSEAMKTLGVRAAIICPRVTANTWTAYMSTIIDRSELRTTYLSNQEQEEEIARAAGFHLESGGEVEQQEIDDGTQNPRLNC